MARAMLAGQDGVEGLDLVLLDADLPDAGDCALPAQLRAEWPAVPIVVISATEDWRRAAEFLHAGMQAFLPTTSRAEVIVNALRLVMSGGRYFPAQVFEVLCAQGLMQPLSSLEEESGGVAALEQSNFDADVPGLSPRQREVLALMIAGRSNKEIAREMNVSVGTVKNYVAIILRIFNTSSRSKAVFAATAAMRGSTAEAA